MENRNVAEAVSKPPYLSDLVAAFVSELDLKTVPPVAIERARLAFVDTVGVMLAGSQLPASAIVCEMVQSEGAAPAVSMVGRSLLTSPQLAALANGVASHAMDFDLSYLMGQPVASLIPALLPVAEQVGASSGELIAAFIVGFEIASRLARANPAHSSVGGWHAVSSIGVIATAAACARLMRAPASKIPSIVGISVSMAGGVPVNFGTMTKPLHAGLAARNAIIAATLGRTGFTASAAALEGRNGYFNAFGRGLDQSWDVFHELGHAYDLAKHGFTVKRYPCGGLAHTAIDAALEIREALGPRVADVSEVKVGITKFAARNISVEYPRSVESAKFSAPFLIAYTLVHGAPMISAFTEQAIDDERVRALARSVSAAIDPSFGDPIEIPLPSRIKVTLADGQTIERVKDYAVGSPALPMSNVQIKEKFVDCATKAVGKERAANIHAALSSLGDKPSLDSLWPLLRAG